MPLLFWTTCHMRVRTRLEGPGSCWGQNPPAVVRLRSGAHTQFVITWRKRETALHMNSCFSIFRNPPHSLKQNVSLLSDCSDWFYELHDSLHSFHEELLWHSFRNLYPSLRAHVFTCRADFWISASFTNTSPSATPRMMLIPAGERDYR